jgi:hypothetical protein
MIETVAASSAVVAEGLVLNRLDRSTSSDKILDEFALEVDGFADPQLGRFESRGQDFFADLGCTVGVLLE